MPKITTLPNRITVPKDKRGVWQIFPLIGASEIEADVRELRLRMMIYDISAYLVAEETRRIEEGEDDGNFDLENFEDDPAMPFFTAREGTQNLIQLPSAHFENRQPEAGNGILGVANIVLRRVETPAERAAAGSGYSWYLKQIVEGNFAVPDDSGVLVDIKMFAQRHEDGTFAKGNLRFQKVGSFGISLKDLKGETSYVRSIAVRFVSLGDHGTGISRGTVLLSQLDPTHNTKGKYKGPRSRATEINLRVPMGIDVGRAPVTQKAKQDTDRRIAPDLTGLYELEIPARAGQETVAPAALWLHQAGDAIVGWYYPFAAMGLSESLFGADANLVPSKHRFVLSSRKTDEFPNKFNFYFALGSRNNNNPDVPKLDPHVLVDNVYHPGGHRFVELREGTFELLTHSDTSTRIRLTLKGKAVNSFDGDTAEGSEDLSAGTVATFNLVNANTRLPWVMLAHFHRIANSTPEVPKRTVEALQAKRIEPLPSNWSELIRRRMQNNPAITTAIHNFSRSGSLIVENVARDIAQEIGSIVNAFPGTQYRLDILTWIADFSATSSCTFDDHVGSDSKTLETWMNDIAETLMNEKIEEKRREKGEELTAAERLDIEKELVESNSVLHDLGAFGPRGGFKYTFKFKNLIKTSIKLLVGGAVGLFLCTIKKQKADAAGNFTVDVYERDCVGGFFGIGAGFSFAFRAGGSAGGGGGPASGEVVTFADIGKDEWSGTNFSVGAFVGPGVGAGLSVVNGSASVFSSSLVVIRPPGREVALSFVVENGPKWSLGPADMRKVVKNTEEGHKGVDAKIALFSVSESIGVMMHAGEGRLEGPPDKDMPITKQQDKSIDASTDIALVNFENGSSVIQKQELHNLDIRIAMYRAIFEMPGWMWCVGFGSPQWASNPAKADEENKKLSQDRADATQGAIFSSIGNAGEGIIPDKDDKQIIAPHGVGRGPSMAPVDGNPPGGGLKDPYKSDVPDEVIKEQKDEYPKWRRADIVVNGFLVAKIRGAEK